MVFCFFRNFRKYITTSLFGIHAGKRQSFPLRWKMQFALWAQLRFELVADNKELMAEMDSMLITW